MHMQYKAFVKGCNIDNFYMKKKYIFAQNIDLGGSNEDPKPMFYSKNKRNNVNPCKPQFYSIKVVCKGV